MGGIKREGIEKHLGQDKAVGIAQPRKVLKTCRMWKTQTIRSKICHENVSVYKRAQIVDRMLDFSLNVVARVNGFVLFSNIKKSCDICIHSVYSIRVKKINLSKSKMKNSHKA